MTDETNEERTTDRAGRSAPEVPAPRAAARRDTLVRGSTLGLGAVLALALLVIVNYFGWKYHQRFDWTASDLYTLSEKSDNVLASLDQGLKPGETIEIVSFLSPASEIYQPLRELAARYEAASGRVSVRFMDLARNPLEAQELLGELDLDQVNRVVVAEKTDGAYGDTRVLLESDLAEFDFSAAHLPGGAPTMRAFKGEQLLTGAIVELAEDRSSRVLFTTGHGERSLDDFGPQGLAGVAEILGQENVEVEEWAPLGKGSVPEGTDLVVIAGPTATFLPPELELLDSYLGEGGRVLVLVDPILEQDGSLRPTGLETWLAGRGLSLGDDLVVDPAGTVPLYGAETLYLTSFGDHPVTRSVSDAGLPVLVRMARSVSSGEAGDAGGAGESGATEVLFTSAEGWGERSLEDLSAQIEPDEGDLQGPVPLAVVLEEEIGAGASAEGAEAPGGDAEEGDAEEGDAAEADGVEAAGEGDEPEGTAGETPEGEGTVDTVEEEPAPRRSRLMVIGDSDFATNDLLTTYIANQVLLVDTFNWLIEREELLGIPPREQEQVRLSLDRSQMRWTLLFSVLFLPAAAILGGLWIWRRRRR